MALLGRTSTIGTTDLRVGKFLGLQIGCLVQIGVESKIK